MENVPELSKLFSLVKAHNRWRGRECINMIASENVTSPLVEALYVSDAMHRYAEGLPFRRYYQGTRYIDEVEVYASDLLSELFKVKYVDLRPISGTIANASVFKALGGHGLVTAITPLSGGGHVSHSEYGIMGALGMKPIPLPFDVEEMNIDVEKAKNLIRNERPRFIVLGGSMFLFPHPIKDVKEIAEEVGSYVVFDAAHVLGLIAGRAFPDPLQEGADVVTASTHKTFPGPQGGVIMTNREDIYKSVRKVVFPVFVSNHHLHRLAAVAGAAIEMMYFGKDYAHQVIKNAKTLATSLHDRGFKVLGEKRGFTETHQVVVDVSKIGGGAKCAEALEEANIIVNKNMLPWDTPDMVKNPSGLRLGTQEITRLGMREEHMEIIASFFERILIRGEDPKHVRGEVVELRREFTEVKYTFKILPDILREVRLS